MSALELSRVSKSRARACQGGCVTGDRYRRSGTWQVWVVGRDAGVWCNDCAKLWRALFENRGLASVEDLKAAA